MDHEAAAAYEAPELGVDPDPPPAPGPVFDPPPAGALRDDPAVDGPTPPAEDEPALGVGVGVGPEDGGPDWPGELGDEPPVGGALVGGVDDPDDEP